MTTDTYTDRIPVNSSNLNCLFYDRETLHLYVEFKSGSIAGYRNVPVAEFESLALANSVGKYYNAYIKAPKIGQPRYPTLNGDVELVKRPDKPVDVPAPAVVPFCPESPAAKTFKVTFLREMTEEIIATDIDDAVKHIQDSYSNAVVKSVTLEF